MGCRWVGRRLGPHLLQDRRERAFSAGLQAQRAARRQLQGPRPAPRVQPPGVCARGAQRRASAPPRAHAAARGPGRGQREGPAQGGEGAGPPRAGGRGGSPGGGGSGGSRSGNVPAAVALPRRTRAHPPARRSAPRRGTLSTARGEYLLRRPPLAAHRDSPGGGGRGPPRLAPLSSTRPARASAVFGALGDARAG